MKNLRTSFGKFCTVAVLGLLLSSEMSFAQRHRGGHRRGHGGQRGTHVNVQVRTNRWGHSGYWNGRVYHYNRIVIRPYHTRIVYNPGTVFNYSGTTYLGSTYLAKDMTDFDTINTNGCGFTGVEMRILNNDANIDHLTILFNNGETEDIDVNAYYQAGSFSALFDLKGYQRCVDEVAIVGEAVSPGGQALIELYGIRQ